MDFFDFFQLAALAFFVIVFLGRSLTLWSTQGINPFVLGAGKKGMGRMLELLLFPWLALWMLAVAMAALHSPFIPFPSLWRPFWPEQPVTRLLGALGILAGQALFVWALVSMGNSWRVGIDEKNAGGLVTSGAFAYLRNPIFAFIDLYFLGTFLLNGSLLFLVFSLAVILALHRQIRQEEKFLASRYGQAYRDYCGHAGRYFKLNISPKEESM